MYVHVGSLANLDEGPAFVEQLFDGEDVGAAQLLVAVVNGIT